MANDYAPDAPADADAPAEPLNLIQGTLDEVDTHPEDWEGMLRPAPDGAKHTTTARRAPKPRLPKSA